MLSALRPVRRIAAIQTATRSASFLGKIFGIGEFEAPKHNKLSRSIEKEKAYDLALLEYVSLNSHPKFMLDEVMENEPDFFMGHVLVGTSQCLLPLDHRDSINAFSSWRRALKLSKSEILTAIEQLHLSALDSMVHGRYREAAAIYETILLRDHSDLLALRCSYDIYLMLGDYKNALGTVTRRLPMWSPTDTGFSHVLSMQAFGLQLQGKVDAAESLAEQALSMNSQDKWAFHTILNVLEVKGNPNHGASYANQYKDVLENGGPLERRMYFHWVLYLLELGRYDRIQQFLHQHIFCPSEGQPSYRGLADATQIAWRLHFAEQPTVDLFQKLYQAWEAVSTTPSSDPVVLPPFARVLRNSVYAVAEKTSGEKKTVEEVDGSDEVDLKSIVSGMNISSVQFSYAPPPASFANTYDAACGAFSAYVEGRYEEATRLLLPIQGSLQLLGETPVDHEIITLLLIDSASRLQDLSLAKALLNERLSEKSQSAQTWQTYSRVFESLGDDSGLRDAQGMSYVLGLGQGGKNAR